MKKQNLHPIARRLALGLGALFCTMFLSGDSQATVVAVIDTGADLNHPSLKDHLWVNAGEIPGNGIDDDGNGFVDDVNGWNFAAASGDVRDRHGHGTHVAGLIADDGVRLMVLKYYEPGTSDAENLKNSVKAIRYAIAMGADIINFSGGGFGRDEEEEAAVKAAAAKGILLVAAAGNDRANSDRRGYYPADYDLPNVLSVASVDADGRLLPSSNYGPRTVALAAPGKDVLSSLPGGFFGRMTGTSQAAAFTSGLAARLWRDRPAERAPANLIAAIARQGRPEKSLEGKTRYQVRLDPALLKVSATVVP